MEPDPLMTGVEDREAVLGVEERPNAGLGAACLPLMLVEDSSESKEDCCRLVLELEPVFEAA